jgi:dienelactone hydrolase
MQLTRLLLGAIALGSSMAHAALVDKPLSFNVGDSEFPGVLIHDDTQPAKRTILLVPNWMGINDGNLQQARLIAGRGYTVYVVDMYGKGIRPTNGEEAGKAAGAVKGDLPAMHARIQTAMKTLIEQDAVSVDPKRIGAIGFCFGGTVALELARTGTAIPAVVSFHGGLATTAPAQSDTLKAKVLVLHGADDPYVPGKEVDAFQVEMRAAKADWQLVSFGNAVHSFTDVDANMAGQAQYNADVARRAYAMMDDFFAETLGAP